MASRILQEGVAQHAVGIEIAFVTGYGFPACSGEPMWFAGGIALEKFKRLYVLMEILIATVNP